MAKRTYSAPPAHSDHDNVGCMQGLFRMFDFRRSPKLLPDGTYLRNKRSVTGNAIATSKLRSLGELHNCINNEKKSRAERVRSGMQSVKTLMEEEMAKSQPSKKKIRSDQEGNTNHEKSLSQANEEKTEQAPPVLNPSDLTIPQSPDSFNFSNPTVFSDSPSEICSQNKIGSFVLGSEKDLFFKLHPDRSICNKSIDETSNSDQSDELFNSKPLNKKRRHSSFWKRDKPETNQGYSRIVILKPSPASVNNSLHESEVDGERPFHHFSFREIKQRLRHAIIESRKERELISIGSDDSTNSGKRLKAERDGDTSNTNSSVRSFSYEEAKKHLIERVDSLGRSDSSLHGQESKPLASLISFPDFDLLSPICSPRKLEEGVDLSNIDVSISAVDREVDLKPVFGMCQEDSSYTVEMTPEERSELLDLFGDVHTEGFNCLDISYSCHDLEQGPSNEPESLSISEETFPNSPERINEEPAVPSVSIFLGISENSSVKREQPSPVSVSEPVVLGDPIHKISKHEESPIHYSIIRIKELDFSPFPSSRPNITILEDQIARFSYISRVLQASGLCRFGKSEKWETEDPLLDPFLFDEIEASADDCAGGSKLLFDLIEEVLLEIREKYFTFTPWVSFINGKVRPAPMGDNLILEVSKGVEWHLRNQFPSSLDQIVGKDLEGGSGSWTDTRPEIEIIVIEMWDEILDDLLEETVFDLWL